MGEKKRIYRSTTIRNKLFWLHFGYDVLRDRPWTMRLAIWPRPNLMTRDTDLGRMVLCLFEFEVVWGPRFCFRNDVHEIADRLAQ